MTDPQQTPSTADYSLLKGGAVTLILGFLATAGGSIWTILSPIGGGVNFAAGFLYEGGMVVGLIGSVLTIIGLFALRSAGRKH